MSLRDEIEEQAARDAAELRKEKEAALRSFEDGCNLVALLFGQDSPQRKIAITARGQMREANGEATT